MEMHRAINRSMPRQLIFGGLVIYLILVFAVGGSSRADVPSLILLRPVAAMILVWALVGFQREDWREVRILPAFLIGTALLTVVHLVPLPFAIWSVLPGRELLVEIGSFARLGLIWRPVSLVPWATWNMLFSLLVPCAAMVFVVQAGRGAWEKILTGFIALGTLSGAIGFLQLVSASSVTLPFYEYTDMTASFGLFANRNHQAVFLACMFPMLAAYASLGQSSHERQKFVKICAIALGVMLVPMLLVTGSRAGIVVGIVGLASTVLIYRPVNVQAPRKRTMRRSWLPHILGASFVLTLTMAALALSRGEALVRFLNSGGENEERLKIWAAMPSMIWKYWPVGSGAGSFVEAYQIDEPRARLTYLYVNHAHNELFEVAMTTGVAGVALATAAFGLWGWAVWRVYRARHVPADERCVVFLRLGLTISLILGLASMVDYPLRVPSLACLGIVAAIWAEVSHKRLRAISRMAEGQC